MKDDRVMDKPIQGQDGSSLENELVDRMDSPEWTKTQPQISFYVLFSRRWGLFLGIKAGKVCWSRINPSGLKTCMYFRNMSYAEWNKQRREDGDPRPNLIGPPMERLVRVYPTDKNSGLATMEDCINSGLLSWNPDQADTMTTAEINEEADKNKSKDQIQMEKRQEEIDEDE